MKHENRDWILIAAFFPIALFVILALSGCASPPCEETSSAIGPIASDLFAGIPHQVRDENGLAVSCPAYLEL